MKALIVVILLPRRSILFVLLAIVGAVIANWLGLWPQLVDIDIDIHLAESSNRALERAKDGWSPW